MNYRHSTDYHKNRKTNYCHPLPKRLEIQSISKTCFRFPKNPVPPAQVEMPAALQNKCHNNSCKNHYGIDSVRFKLHIEHKYIYHERKTYCYYVSRTS